MKILALETTSLSGGVALLDDSEVIGIEDLAADQRSAGYLAPAISRLLERHQHGPRDIELVAVASGPGSFTGLRVGITTAKTFAYVTKCDVLGVNSLQAIAMGYPDECSRLSVVLDAQRKELFVAEFAVDGQSIPRTLQETTILSRADWISSVQDDPGCVVTGPGLGKIVDDLPDTIRVGDSKVWRPTATSIGRLASQLFASGERTDLWSMAPNYFRKSAAEENAGK